MVAQFTAVYLKRGKWFLGYVEEIPGVNTQGKTLAEAKKLACNMKAMFAMIRDKRAQPGGMAAMAMPDGMVMGGEKSSR